MAKVRKRFVDKYTLHVNNFKETTDKEKIKQILNVEPNSSKETKEKAIKQICIFVRDICRNIEKENR